MCIEMNPKTIIPWAIIATSGIFEAVFGGTLLTSSCQGTPVIGSILMFIGFATVFSAYALPIDEKSDKEKAELRRWREHRFEGIDHRGVNAPQRGEASDD